MKLLRAAAKAAGQVGTLYAENLIREDVLAKRDERLRAANVEDREARYAHDEAMFDKRTAHQTALADKQWERDQTLSDKEWERQQGRITDTFQGAEGYYGITAGGAVKQFPELSKEVAAANTRETKQKAVENIQKLKEKLMGEVGTLPKEEFDEQWTALEQMEREVYMKPEQVASQREQAEMAALKPEILPRIQAAQQRGIEKDKLVSTYRNAGREDAARAVEQFWTDSPGSQQASQPAPGTPEFTSLPTEQRRNIILSQKQEDRREQRAEEKAENKLEARLPWMRAMAEKLKRAPITDRSLDAVEQNYAFIKDAAESGLLSESEVSRFNAAIRAQNSGKYQGAQVLDPLTGANAGLVQ